MHKCRDAECIDSVVGVGWGYLPQKEFGCYQSGIWSYVKIESDLTEDEGPREGVGCVPHPESFYDHTQDHSLKRVGGKTLQMHMSVYSIEHRQCAPTPKLSNSTKTCMWKKRPPAAVSAPIA